MCLSSQTAFQYNAIQVACAWVAHKNISSSVILF